MMRYLAVNVCVLMLLAALPSLYAVDDIPDKKAVLPDSKSREKSFTVKCKYLIIPICNKSKKTIFEVYIGTEKIRVYDVPLATDPEKVDWYAFFTIEDFKGKDARVIAGKATSRGFELVKQSDSIPGEGNFYKEPHRPQFHFSQKVGWNNDPNGMVYLNGVWHFFFQHNPVGLPWGNMTWGHATSTDLIHWKQQPNKLFPKTMAVRDCFSGSATVDKKNTSGWGKDTLVAFFTDTGCGECIAYSTDSGKSFTYYKGNPVVKHKGRDPKVIWYEYGRNDTPINARAKELGGHWVMAVYDQKGGNNAAFYTSVNMKDWTEQSHLPGYFECTELFELPVDGDKNNARWVVFAADAKYAIGAFDGKVFTPEHEGKYRVHYGKYYASQTFDNAPDGRKIQMGWVRIASPGPFNQMFSFPHRLTLRTTEIGIRMFAEPIKEIEKLYTKKFAIKSKKLADNVPVSLPVKGACFDITAVYEVGDAKEILLELPGKTIRYDVAKNKLNGTALEPVDGKLTVRVLADRSIMEIIGNEGRVYITDEYKFQGRFDQIKVVAVGGNAKLVRLETNSIKSIWTK